MSLLAFYKDILAVVVVYNKSLKNSTSLLSIEPIAKEGLEILVFDNSKQPQVVKDTTLYYHQPNNVGVSGAYNYGSKIAQEKNKKWLWLLDDDTDLTSSFLQEAYNQLQIKKHQLIVPRVFSNQQLLSPFSYVKNKPMRLKNLKSGTYNLVNLRPINSGILIQLNTFLHAGGYNECLPLDFSDIEFTDRLQQSCTTFFVTQTSFSHTFSGDEKQTQNQSFERFKRFAESAKYYASTVKHPLHVRFQVLKRALKLSVQFASVQFIHHYLKTKN